MRSPTAKANSSNKIISNSQLDTTSKLNLQQKEQLNSLFERITVNENKPDIASNQSRSKIAEPATLSQSALVKLPQSISNELAATTLQHSFPEKLSNKIFANLKSNTKNLSGLWNTVKPPPRYLLICTPFEQAKQIVVLHRFTDIPLIENGAVEDCLRSETYGVQHFLHANLIDFPERLQFIASQRPFKNEQQDEIPGFWHMVHQRQIPVIVDLTKPEENKNEFDYSFGKERNQKTKECGPLTITLPEKKALGNMRMFPARVSGHVVATEKIFSISHGGKSHDVKRIHFKDWPDHGVITPETLIALADQTEAAGKGSDAPILIHCRAGVGRTGTLISFIVARKLIAKELEQGRGPVSIAMIGKILLDVTAKGRLGRGPMFVQSAGQFHLAADALAQDFARRSQTSQQTSPSGRRSGQLQNDNIRRTLQSSQEQNEVKGESKPVKKDAMPLLRAFKHGRLENRQKLLLSAVQEDGDEGEGESTKSLIMLDGAASSGQLSAKIDMRSPVDVIPGSEKIFMSQADNPSTKTGEIVVSAIPRVVNDDINNDVINADVVHAKAADLAVNVLDIANAAAANLNDARISPAVAEGVSTKVVEPEVVEPEVVEPEVVEPEVVKPEVVEPEVVKPEVVEPEVIEPEVVEPEVVELEVVETAVVYPEVVKPEVVTPGVERLEVAPPVDLPQEVEPPKTSTSTSASADDSNIDSADTYSADTNLLSGLGADPNTNIFTTNSTAAHIKNSPNPTSQPRQVSTSVARLWLELSNAKKDSNVFLNDDTTEQEVTGLPCVAATAVSVTINNEQKYVHANHLRLPQLPTLTQPDPAPHRYIAGQSPQLFAACEKILLKAIESREGIFQLVSPATHNRLRGDLVEEEKKLSVAPILLQLLAKQARGEEITIGNHYRVILIKKESTADHIASYDLTFHSPTNNETFTIPLTQVGLPFDNAVLKEDDIKAADLAFAEHLQSSIAANPHSGAEPIIISRKGVGRNATLIVYHDVLQSIRSGQVTSDAELDATLLSVIGEGRKARSSHFVHSAQQLQELRNALLTAMAAQQNR